MKYKTITESDLPFQPKDEWTLKGKNIWTNCVNDGTKSMNCAFFEYRRPTNDRFVKSDTVKGGNFAEYRISDMSPEHGFGSHHGRIKVYSASPALQEHIIALLNANPMPEPAPEWSVFPENIRWVAMDADKRWFGFTKKPYPLKGVWAAEDPEHIRIGEGIVTLACVNWKESLLERPAP